MRLALMRGFLGEWRSMKASQIIALVIWAWVVGGNILSTWTMAPTEFRGIPWIVVILPIVVIIGAFRGTRGRGANIVRWIDQRFGQGTFREFIRTLKPELMFATMGFCIVAVALVRAFLLGTPVLPPPIVGFFTTGGIAFVAAYYIRLRREAA
jgi:hypothetical protein